MSTMKIDGIDVPEIRQSDFYALLEDEENTLVFGNKGIGKSSIVRKFAKDKDTISLPISHNDTRVYWWCTIRTSKE